MIRYAQSLQRICIKFFFGVATNSAPTQRTAVQCKLRRQSRVECVSPSTKSQCVVICLHPCRRSTPYLPIDDMK